MNISKIETIYKINSIKINITTSNNKFKNLKIMNYGGFYSGFKEENLNKNNINFISITVTNKLDNRKHIIKLEKTDSVRKKIENKKYLLMSLKKEVFFAFLNNIINIFNNTREIKQFKSILIYGDNKLKIRIKENKNYINELLLTTDNLKITVKTEKQIITEENQKLNSILDKLNKYNNISSQTFNLQKNLH